ncbi:MAG: hypothetical protein ACRC62_32800 [Microcoleus sp.]
MKNTLPLRIKLWYIPAFCVFAIATFYVVRLQNLFDSFSNLIVERKPHDMDLISKSLTLIEKAGSKATMEENIAALAGGSHRNTAFLMFKEGRKYPDLIVQPSKPISSDVIRKSIERWQAEKFGSALYHDGIPLDPKDPSYHLIARRQTVKEGSYELFLVTNIDAAVAAEYNASTVALSALLIAMSGAIIPALLSVTASVKKTTESIANDNIRSSWYWSSEVVEQFNAIKNYKTAAERYKIQIDQSTSGQVIVKTRGQEEAIIYSANKAMADISGHTRSELENQPLNMIVPKQYHHYHFGIGEFDKDLGRRVGMHAYSS